MGLYAALRPLCATASVDVALAAVVGATTLNLYSTVGLSVGMSLSGSAALGGNVTISAISGNVITLSAGLTEAIPPNTSLSASGALAAAGVVASVVQATASVWLFMPIDSALTWTSSATVGSTITVTQAVLANNGAESLRDTGNDWDKSGFAWNPLQFRTAASAVNGVEIGGAITGNGVLVSATGSDSNVQLYLSSQGSDPVSVLTRQSLEQCRIDDFAGATNYAYIRGGTAVQPPLFSSGGSAQAGVALSGAGSGQTLLGSSGVTGSAVVWQGAQVDKSYVLVFPQSGQTVNVPNNCSLFQIGGGPSLTFSSLTVVMPTDPSDGQRVIVAVEGSASGLVFAANPGQVIDPPTTLGPGNSAEWWWNQQYTVWFRLR